MFQPNSKNAKTENGHKKKFIFKISFLLCLILFGISVHQNAQAATLYFSPSSGNFTVGNIFTINVLVNTEGVVINNAEAIINFPNNLLEIVSVSKSGSIFSLWVEEPTFSNSAGTLSFNGGLPTPGFNGSAGKILGAVFRVKKVGSASLVFSSAAVRANDGYGTNVFKTGAQALFDLISEEKPLPPEEKLPPEEIIPSATLGVPLAPKISSPTYPDLEKWYSNNAPEFTWKLPSDVTAISYAIDQNSSTNPKFIAETLIDKVSFSDQKDGIWYFHINFKNQYGWGKITHRKVLIDTVPPLPFEIKVQKEDATDPQPILFFETKDEFSGLEYYEIKIGEGDTFPVSREITKHNPYQLPPQSSGQHPIEVKAFDKARNFALATTEIEVLPIEPPIITKYPKRLNLGDDLNLEGTGLAETTILVFIQQKGKEPIIGETKANKDGFWQFSLSKALEKGEYKVLVQARDKRGALSLSSNVITFEVGLPPFLKFGKIVIDYLSIVATLIVLIIGALLVIFYGWYRISLWRRKIRTETKEVTQVVLKAFRALREEVQEQIEYLDGKPGLSEEEKKIRDKLQEALDISEKFIGKELEDIEKELE